MPMPDRTGIPEPGQMTKRALDSRCGENDGWGVSALPMPDRACIPALGQMKTRALDSRCGENDGGWGRRTDFRC